MLTQGSSTRVVLVDANSGQTVTTADVSARAAELGSLVSAGSLAFLACDNSLQNAWDFLALFEAGIAQALVDPRLDSGLLAALIDTYSPEVFLGVDPGAFGHIEIVPGVWRCDERGPSTHPDLAVLLTTSGSTGSPKFVRLSRENVLVNASQIVASLGIRDDDVAVTALPLFYSYGMSILTSHALSGSPVVVTDRSVLDKDFWTSIASHGVTFMPGVPQTYAMLDRLGFAERDLPKLRALTQAGGRLDPGVVSTYSRLMRSRGGDFFVMYGQTEAGPRIACLPSQRLPEKLGSAGVAVEGGRLAVMEDDRELPAGSIGEIVYIGPNVMMGYATKREDLSLDDVQGPSLQTGDVGYVDEEGFLYLTGRTKRIAKLAGARVSLDELEQLATDLFPVAAVDANSDGVVLFTTVGDADLRKAARRALASELRVAVKLLDVVYLPELPLMNSGKVDYAALTQRARKGAIHESP